MPKRRSQVEMTEQEIATYLGQHGTMTLATVGPDGSPHLVAMAYGLLEGNVVWWGYEKSQKVVNIRRDPRSTVLVTSGASGRQLAGVSITGTSEVIADHQFVARVVGPVIYSSMYRCEVDAARQEYLDKIAAKRVAVVLHATRFRSWNHSKLPRDGTS